MSNIHDKRWQALRFAVDTVDLATSLADEFDLGVPKDKIANFRETLLEMQEDALIQKRNAKGVDDQALDLGTRKRDFIQNHGEITTQIALYRLLADGQELMVKSMQGTVMFPALQQQKLIRQLDDLIKETEKFSGRKFQ